MVWVGSNLKDHLVPTPLPSAGTPSLGAQSPVQPGLEHCQGGGSHSFSGQPGPGPHHPQSEEFLPYIESQSNLFQFITIMPCPIATGPTKICPHSLMAPKSSQVGQ